MSTAETTLHPGTRHHLSNIVNPLTVRKRLDNRSQHPTDAQQTLGTHRPMTEGVRVSPTMDEVNAREVDRPSAVAVQVDR